MSAGTLIVGAGQAGLQIAASLRAGGDDRPITIVGVEPYLPYQRPPLSKEFLTAAAHPETLALRPPSFYSEQHIDLLCGDRVEKIVLDEDPGADGAGYALTGRGTRLAFAALALATGARPRRLELPGAGLEGVFVLRTIDDAIALRARLATARSVVVIGGGFIGLEVAAAARAHGLSVIVAEAATRLLARSVAPVVSEFYLRAHTRREVDVRIGVTVTGIEGADGRVRRVEFSDGSRADADLVLVGVGVTPRMELARQLGLECQGGIVVDSCSRTSAPLVVAAGDCTVFPSPTTGDGLVRLESVDNAISQARVAAATLLGVPQPYQGVPWFWSDQYNLKLQTAGLSRGYDSFITRGDPASEKFSVLYYKDNVLCAVDAVNHAADYIAVRRALSLGTTIAPELARDSGVKLKELIAGR